MLTNTNKAKIIDYLKGMGLSLNQSRKLLLQSMGANGATVGTITLRLDGDQFIVTDSKDGAMSGLDLMSGELI